MDCCGFSKQKNIIILSENYINKVIDYGVNSGQFVGCKPPWNDFLNKNYQFLSYIIQCDDIRQ